MSVSPHPRLKNTRLDHGPAILRRVVSDDIVGVEVGVLRGRLSEYLLTKHLGITLHMVDWWQAFAEDDPVRSWSIAHQEPCAQQSAEQVEDNYHAARAVAARFGARAVIHRGKSVDVAAEFADASLDFVFIDADHRYEAVVADIAAWFPKVKPGGWVGGHDYGTPELGGEVSRAVDEFIKRTGLVLELCSFYTWFARVPAGGAR